MPNLSRFKNLRYLHCSNNNLTSLPKLNETLIELWCDNNKLISLPKLNTKLKSITSDLRTKIDELSASTVNDERVIANALKEAQDQVRQLVTRSNPQYVKELKKEVAFEYRWGKQQVVIYGDAIDYWTFPLAIWQEKVLQGKFYFE